MRACPPLPGRLDLSFRSLLLAGSLAILATSGPSAHATSTQSPTDIAADAAPEIRQVTPNQAAAGSETTLEISGLNFAAGVYVSFSDPGVLVISTQRISATQLEAKLSVSPNAAPSSVTLYVSNPASTIAQTSFTIAAAGAPPAPVNPPATVTPPANNLIPSQPGGNAEPASSGTPEVTKVEPASAGRGGGATLKITGKNFFAGVKVAFANPGIQVLQTRVDKSNRLTVLLKIAADAATGTGSLYVVNPGDLEAESQFEVTTATPGKIPAVTSDDGHKTNETTTTGGISSSNAVADQSFSVYSLASAISILHSSGKIKGTLSISGKTLRYQEGGSDVFAIPFSDIQEVEENVIFGVKSGTFHLITKTGKVYNFIASSLKPADTQTIVSAIQAALK